MKTKILVIGGGYAGLLCALRLARRTSAEIVLVEARPFFVERVRLHEDIAGKRRERRSIAEMLAGTGVGLRVGWVSGVDLEARRATIETDAGVVREAFDELVLATGSIAAKRGMPGIEHAFACDTEESSIVLAERLSRSKSVVVVGGGLTGLEIAAELGARRRELAVTLVTAGMLAEASLVETSRAYAANTLARLDVSLRENERVAAIEERAVVLASGDVIPSDCTIWTGGLAPSPLAQSIGLAVDETGRAIVDARLRSASHPFVHVAGDAARVSFGPHTLRMACATAMPMGAFCADDIARTIANREARPFGFSFMLQCASLGRDSGLVQRVDATDAPRPRFWGGRPAAWFKEGLCRYTMLGMAMERRGYAYRWPSAPMIDGGGAQSAEHPESRLGGVGGRSPLTGKAEPALQLAQRT
jgi:NADH dehydrogenase FAD-containing subunit